MPHAKQRRRDKLVNRDGPGCVVCGYQGPKTLTIHHIKKQCSGGSNSLDNLCLLCEDCHVFWHQNEAKDFWVWVSQIQRYLEKLGAIEFVEDEDVA